MLGSLTRLVTLARRGEEAEATDCESSSESGDSQSSGVFEDACDSIASVDAEDVLFVEPAANQRRASLDLTRGLRASLDRPRRSQPAVEEDRGGTLPSKHWADGDYTLFRLRGSLYLSDRRKVAAESAVCALAAVDLFEVESPVRDIASQPRSWLQRFRRAGSTAFVFSVQFQNPGSKDKPRTSMSMYFSAAHGETLRELLQGSTPFCSALRRFAAGDSGILKVIPCVTSGPPLVRGLIPRTPVLVAKNVPGTTVFVRENDIAVDVDVTTCAWADRFFRHIFHRFAGALQGDLAFVLEGRSGDSLPERLLGVAHIANVSPSLSTRWR